MDAEKVEELEQCLETLRDHGFSLLSQATLSAEDFDKDTFNGIAKSFLDTAEQIQKLASSSREAKRCAEVCKKLTHFSIKTIKASHAKPNGRAAKAAQQSFQKAVNKFNKGYDDICAYVEKKSGKIKKKDQTVSPETARRRVTMTPAAPKEKKSKEDKPKKEKEKNSSAKSKEKKPSSPVKEKKTPTPKKKTEKTYTKQRI